MEKEPTSEKKLIIPEGKDLLKLLTKNLEISSKKEKKKEEEKIPLSRQDFFLRLEQQIDFSNKNIVDLQMETLDEKVKLAEFYGLKDKVYDLEDLGFKLSFFERGKQLGIEIEKKPKVGFRRKNNNNQ